MEVTSYDPAYFVSIFFFMSFLVIPFGLIVTSMISQNNRRPLFTGIVDRFCGFIWWVGMFSSIVTIPYVVVTTYLIYMSTRPSWESYEFGNLFAAMFIVFLMLACIILPIVETVRWNKRTK